MRRVIIESPYAGNIAENTLYARAAMLDCLLRDEAPFVSHLLYTQVLDDTRPDERRAGMRAGYLWIECAELTAVYVDLGVSSGMIRGMSRAQQLGIPIEERRIPDWKRLLEEHAIR